MFVTFRIRHSQAECTLITFVCVSVCLFVPRRITLYNCTSYNANFQWVLGFGCYGNIRAYCEMSAKLLVLHVWLVLSVYIPVFVLICWENSVASFFQESRKFACHFCAPRPLPARSAKTKITEKLSSDATMFVHEWRHNKLTNYSQY